MTGLEPATPAFTNCEVTDFTTIPQYFKQRIFENSAVELVKIWSLIFEVTVLLTTAYFFEHLLLDVSFFLTIQIYKQYFRMSSFF